MDTIGRPPFACGQQSIGVSSEEIILQDRTWAKDTEKQKNIILISLLIPLPDRNLKPLPYRNQTRDNYMLGTLPLYSSGGTHRDLKRNRGGTGILRRE